MLVGAKRLMIAKSPEIPVSIGNELKRTFPRVLSLKASAWPQHSYDSQFSLPVTGHFACLPRFLSFCENVVKQHGK